MAKFAESARLVREERIAQVIDPGTIDERDLLRVHAAEYIESLKTGAYNEMTALKLGLPWHPTIGLRARAATAGTLAAARAAMEDGIACNLAGGTHHAFPDRGEGFCVFNDVAVAIRTLQHDEPFIQCIVIDLDAHQGNGTNFIFAGDSNVFTYSIHVGRNYPSRKEPGSRDVELPRFVSGEAYLDALHTTLPECVDRFEPDLAFINLGVDVHTDDRFGQMHLSTEQMRQRDQFAIDLCRDWGIPVALVYGGGYNKTLGMTTALHVQSARVASERFRREHRNGGST
ncbi:MAG: histone deacetylase [Tepidisphaeraceae bacterium]